MGLFDLPAPLFAWLDGWLQPLPPLLRLLLWGIVGGVVSMLLYRWLSPQAAIARGKRELLAARRALDGHDGPFEQALPLARHLLAESLRQVGRTGVPALLASLPMISLLAWLSSAYGHDWPAPGAEPAITVEPAAVTARWEPQGAPRIVLEAGGDVLVVALAAPVPLLHKRQWWNALLGNPAGYLPAEAPAQRLHIALPPRHYVDIGPPWLRGWLPVFFASLLAASLLLKRVARIE